MKAAVLGKPIEHSLSPILHMAAYKVLGLDWQFEKHEVDVEGLAAFLQSAPSDIAGYALTMPLKDEAFERAASSDVYAARTQAANTLIRGDKGWYAFNTDAPGFVSALRKAEVASVSNPVVIGGGATARSAIAALQDLGTQKVTVVARRESAVSEIRILFPELHVEGIPFLNTPIAGDVVISTLPAGAADHLEVANSVNVFFDVIYAPWPTMMAREAMKSGITVLGGLDLLVSQAVEQVILMTHCSDELRADLASAMYEAGLAVQQQRSRAD